MIKVKTDNWMLDNIDTVLFDKDGTFIDLHYFWGKMTELRAKEVIMYYGLSDDLFDELCLYLGYDVNRKKMLSDGITALYSRSKIIEIFNQRLKKLGVNRGVNKGVNSKEEEIALLFDKVNYEFYKSIDKYTKPIWSAVDFIVKIKAAGIKTGIVTSDSVVSTGLTLKQYNWENLFDVVIGRESSSYTKESGELTKIALEEIKADPKRTLMIGDASTDFISAQKAGINKVILVATGQIGLEELKKITPFSLENLGQLDLILC